MLKNLLFLDKVTLEGGYGFNMAMSPDNIDLADVSGLNTVQLSANYQLDNLWRVPEPIQIQPLT